MSNVFLDEIYLSMKNYKLYRPCIWNPPSSESESAVKWKNDGDVIITDLALSLDYFECGDISQV